MPVLDPAHPVRTLFTAFTAWKALLLAIALGSGVGPAYDTSSTLVSSSVTTSDESLFDLATKLTRWDAIYFLQASRRAYVFEQEWAFGLGLPTLISFLTGLAGRPGDASAAAVVGVVVAHVSHLLSVLVLYQLGQVVWGDRRLSLTAAALHVISPAGLFLSAPYNESTFAFLSFLGYLFFAKALLSPRRGAAHDVGLVAAGMWFGFSNTFRANGLLNGVLFAVELCRELACPPTLQSVRRRCALLVGGSSVALGFLLPQVVAYRTFCYAADPAAVRSWCNSALPSIHSFVQKHYWNVGFLRYWRLPNLPLFLLAAPVLYLLVRSGCETLQAPSSLLAATTTATSKTKPSQPGDPAARSSFLRSLAAIQLVLALLAITNYHVQIITRISSGYPLWYFWLAAMLRQDGKTSRFAGGAVVFMAMYATVQGALYASFLPPA